ncbi:hypothetical protein [Actinokineospora pegani]|uniref:hypothetical protein n=1 Tax=Actinokineospora pegani TaxID=2654637 RepID=UPI0012EAA412|nr:hypothetical protein [Actinokineospora pegani]
MVRISRRWYRRAWLGVAALVGSIGLGAGVVLLGTASLAMIAVTASCLAVALCLGCADLTGVRLPPLPVLAGLLAVIVAVVGLVLLLDSAAMHVLAALAFTGAPLLWLRDRFLDTDQLRGRWDDAAARLERAHDAAEAAAALRVRASCLAELERRDPELVARWLAAGHPEPA